VALIDDAIPKCRTFRYDYTLIEIVYTIHTLILQRREREPRIGGISNS
jgi:hypothetical protein